MKNVVYRILDSTLGKLIRLITNLNIRRPQILEVESVYDLVLKQSRIESAEYAVKRMTTALYFQDRESLWRYCIKIRTEKIQKLSANYVPILLEFGVFEGRSLKYFREIFADGECHGFDSFQGLEEDWYGYIGAKGTFDLGGKIPKLGRDVVLHKGWFEDTLPKFQHNLGDRQIDIIHCDCDTYKPTHFVLSSLIYNLKPGSIIIFDEYFGYPSWKMHEFKAWQELVEFHNIKYAYIAYSSLQVAVEILDRK